MQTTIDTINFTRGVPANESFPVADVADAAQGALRQHGPAMLQYGPSAGFLPLREWLADWQGVVEPVQLLPDQAPIEFTEELGRQYTLRLIMAVARQAVKEAQ